FTSFVAVEEMIVTDGGQPRRIDVPVEVPEGVNRDGVFGEEQRGLAKSANGYMRLQVIAGLSNRAAAQTAQVYGVSTESRKATGVGKGVGAGRTGNVGSGSRRAGGGGPGGAAAAEPSPPNQPMAGAISADEAVSVNGRSPEEQWREQLLAKVHPSIVSLIERVKTKE